MSTEWPILGGEEEEQPYMIVGVPTGDERTIDRVALNRSQYHQITDDKGWREAGTYTEEDGSTAFKAAGLLEDGTLVGHLESHLSLIHI